ncbi:trafficking protein particle complex subunit 14 isoform X3 [Hemicordylus capensis]|uniref:trafficking protein particle complex subunit 14 isoform X3 n=1 Tax=Hemicordylus capensis TaxID=884348 RepID=UPI0023043E52|nr:trafficking protein particle complex subunit 14 isoform X3 [Hemicordylus capensis]
MESQCDYFMYFPAVPFPAREVLLGEPGRYRALPRRNHLYLGETVRFLLVLRCRSSGGAGGARPPWGQLAGSLSALASVSPAAGASSSSSSSSALVAGAGGEGAPHEAPAGDTHEQEAEEEEAEEEGGGGGESLGCRRRGSLFRDCRALLTHGHGPPGRAAAGVPIEEPIVSTDEVIFPLTISLDRLPPTTLKAKIVVTVWKRDQEKAEVRERGYLSILQDRSPSQTFREEQGAFKAQVSTMLTVLPPPELKCQQLSVSGKHLTVLKVLNAASQEELSVWDVRILPNLNASYLPMMPDGSVLLVDDVCHQSGEVSMASFCRLSSATSACPCSLRALEEQNFLFQLQAPEQPPDSTKEGLEVPLIAVVQWSTPKLPFTTSIYTHYRLPSIRLARPRFVMTAECESPVVLHRRFTVTYTLINNLQDFLAVRLVWTPESAAAGQSLAPELFWPLSPLLLSPQARSSRVRNAAPSRTPRMPSSATPPSTTWDSPTRAAPAPSASPSRPCGLACTSCPST